MKDNKTLSRQRSFMLRKTQHEVGVNSIEINTATVTIRNEKNYKKNVATQKLLLRHSKELKAETFVATKEDYVVTIKVVE